jgi:hypothetical protein
MAKKRLAFDVEETLHSTLKQKAAELGVPLGALCSSLLEGGLEGDREIVAAVKIDPELYPSLPLDFLRGEIVRLASERPGGWDADVRRINSEISKRYIVR